MQFEVSEIVRLSAAIVRGEEGSSREKDVDREQGGVRFSFCDGIPSSSIEPPMRPTETVDGTNGKSEVASFCEYNV